MQKGNGLKAPHRAIAAAVVSIRSGDLLLQLRDTARHHLSRGIGLFAAIARAMKVRSTAWFVNSPRADLRHRAGAFLPLAHREGETARERVGRFRRLFLVRDVPRDKITITEGTLFVVAPGELTRIENRLTPTARFALDAISPCARRGDRRIRQIIRCLARIFAKLLGDRNLSVLLPANQRYRTIMPRA